MKKYFFFGIALAAIGTLTAFMIKAPKSVPTPAPVYVPPAPIPPAPPPAPYNGTFPRAENDHKIQVALILDTSNSMDGLIDQAKSQIWKMVNELADTRKNGEVAGIELALYEYGNDELSVGNGYVRKITPLTTDLDYIFSTIIQPPNPGWSGILWKSHLRCSF